MNDLSKFVLQENILIVDDNPANLNLLNEILSQQGYKVRAALSGKIALKSVKIAPPDLILLDILMPEMDGYEVCQELKNSPLTKDIPVIFISALNEVFDKIKAFSMGGVDYIPKPFRAEEVLVRIQNQLRICRLSRQLLQQNNYLQQELLERQKAEHALKESQSLLKGIIEGTTDQIAALNLEFRYIAFNSAYQREFYKIFGQEIAIGSSLIDVLADQSEVQEKMVNLWKRALAGEQFSLIQEFTNSDRDRSYYEITYSTIQNFNGQQIGASHIIKNVTDRIRAEKALRQSEERYRALVTATSEAVWITDNKEDFNTTNSYWLNLTGQTESNLQSGEWINAIHPEDREKVLQTWKTALANQTMYEVEYRLQTVDHQERDILARGVPIYTEKGQIREWIGTYNDITEKRALERQLAHQKELLDAFFRSAHVGMCAIDNQRRYFLVNEALAEINGFSVQDHIGKTPLDIVPDLASKQEAAFQQVLTTGQPVPQLELSGETQKLPGVTRTWLTSYFPIHNQNYQPIGIGIVMVEITQRITAEAALRKSEAQFQLFMNNSPSLAWIVSENGTFFYCNRSFENWIERSNNEIMGKNIFDIFSPEVAQQFFKNNQEVLRTGLVLEIYESSFSTNKVKHDFLVYKFPLPQEDGEVLIGGTAIDITERIRAEEALTQSRQRLQYLLTASPAVIYSAKPDQNYRATYISENVSKILGYEAREFLKEPNFWLSHIHPDDREILLSELSQLSNQTLYSKEYRFLHADGTYHWLHDEINFIHDETGENTEVVGYIVDISDRKKAEKELEFQAVITRNMAEGICLTRAADWKIVYANPKFENLFNYEPGELNGKPVSMLNYNEQNLNAEENIKQIIGKIEKCGAVSCEIHSIKKDGTPFWCQATISQFEHPDYGTVYVAIQHDITEQKQAQEQIKNSLKEKEVLLKEIHHRVKNNLQIVKSLLHIQSKRTQQEEALLVLQDSQNRIASIALVHEKIYRSEDLAKVDFSQYIPSLTTHLFHTYNVNANHINLKLEIENLFLEIDNAIPCGLIINELVSNSLKYAFPNNQQGEIIVKFATNEEGKMELIVQDNGVGIPEDFDIERSLSSGLKLVQALVKQLKGKMEIDRTQRTKFIISFGLSSN